MYKYFVGSFMLYQFIHFCIYGGILKASLCTYLSITVNLKQNSYLKDFLKDLYDFKLCICVWSVYRYVHTYYALLQMLIKVRGVRLPLRCEQKIANS